MNELKQFVDFCRKVQPQSQDDIRRFFEGVVFFPYDNELLLQAFLFLNIQDYFPSCIELLLFENCPDGNNMHQGKCDFVYLTHNEEIVLIETKFINTKSTGATERTRRKEHRNKVFQQVLALQKKFSETWRIPPELINCCVFTTENLARREEARTVTARHVSIDSLNQWQEDLRQRLLTGS
jgi:hypothetical protein